MNEKEKRPSGDRDGTALGGPTAPGVGSSGGLSHLEDDGQRARMVDVGDKQSSRRSALAQAVVEFPEGVLEAVMAGDGPKGPIEEVCRVAGILGAKRTSDLIPMCHPLGLDHVEVQFLPRPPRQLVILCRASCQGPTGVEMEALTGASLAALTVIDMTKALSKGIVVDQVRLLEKSGGKSGHWRASGWKGDET